MTSVDDIRNALSVAVTAVGGQDTAIEMCDRMYRHEFRSEPYTLGALISRVSYFSDSHNVNQLINELFGPNVTLDTLIVSVLNYKGEEDSLRLYADAKHLPVFKSKDQSFFQANNLIGN